MRNHLLHGLAVFYRRVQVCRRWLCWCLTFSLTFVVRRGRWTLPLRASSELIIILRLLESFVCLRLRRGRCSVCLYLFRNILIVVHTRYYREREAALPDGNHPSADACPTPWNRGYMSDIKFLEGCLFLSFFFRHKTSSSMKCLTFAYLFHFFIHFLDLTNKILNTINTFLSHTYYFSRKQWHVLPHNNIVIGLVFIGVQF